MAAHNATGGSGGDGGGECGIGGGAARELLKLHVAGHCKQCGRVARAKL